MRIGTAEIYRGLAAVPEVEDALVVNLDLPGGRFFMPLFVKLRDGRQLDDEIERAINDRLRTAYSPRHVPDRIVQVAAIPYTLTGKKLEVPVRRILSGVPPRRLRTATRWPIRRRSTSSSITRGRSATTRCRGCNVAVREAAVSR